MRLAAAVLCALARAPLAINETGFATVPGRTEAPQPGRCARPFGRPDGDRILIAWSVPGAARITVRIDGWSRAPEYRLDGRAEPPPIARPESP